MDLGDLPGGYGNTTHGEGVRRGVGYGVGIKNICFSEGFDDYSTATVRLEVIDGEPVAVVHTAAAEVGQGLVTLQAQIARTELGVETVDHPAGGHHGRLGRVVVGVPAVVHVRRRGEGRLRGGAGPHRHPGRPAHVRISRSPAARSSRPPTGVLTGLVDVLAPGAVEATAVFRHRPTSRSIR